MAVEPASAGGHTGRRPGKSGTREAILEAAKAKFAEAGYDSVSMRSIAKQAGVDPALVTHYFGSKPELFASVVELPYDPTVVMPQALAGDREGIGLRFAKVIVGILESEEGRRRMTSIVRAAASEPRAAELVRELIMAQVMAPVVESLGVDDGPLRASLVSTQAVGLIMSRYITRIEPLASLPPDEVAAKIAPVFQHYLVEPL